MDPRDVVNAFYGALARSGPEAAAAYLADDLQLEQAPAPVQDPDSWLAMQLVWRQGFPDLAIESEVLTVDGDVVHGRGAGRGTHSGDLDLSPLGLGTIAASGREIRNLTMVDWTVRGDKIVSGVATAGEGGGIPGILAQLGVELPNS